MKQINVSVDDSTFLSLSSLCSQRGTSMTDFMRSSISRILNPIKQIATIELTTCNLEKAIKKETREVEAKLVEFELDGLSFWNVSISISDDSMFQKFPFLQKCKITFSDGRSGYAACHTAKSHGFEFHAGFNGVTPLKKAKS